MSVLADGTFDPFHIGHLRYLQAAKQLCGSRESLLVRVARDEEIIAKGRKPFQMYIDRLRMIQSLEEVESCSWWNTAAICSEEMRETLAGAIIQVRPRLLVKGIDWHGRLPPDVVSACEEMGTAIVYVPTREKSSAERLQP